ncbi:MAG: adenine nucleotide alpha hydrolase [Geminicoccaceae bacterium]
MNAAPDRLDALHHCLDDAAPAAVAVSGGVDSMTLAFIAHRRLAGRLSVFHAVSPAVPASATARVEAYAAKEGWAITIVDAGEFGDERYMANPSNRCFFCKTNLYGTLAKMTEDQLLSGTNLDDLGDWRPGLKAAEAEGVRHPFVEAEIDKSTVRRLAGHFGLNDLAELPAAPCLSSRIETGLRIDADLLPRIDRVETMLRQRLSPETVRCRLRRNGVVVEIDQATLDSLDAAARQAVTLEISALVGAAAAGGVDFEPYRRGSAFLREQAEAAF